MRTSKGFEAQEVTKYWKLYEAGKDWNRRINLYNDVNKNTEFYIGNHWLGIKAGNLDKPVFNILKRIINYFISVLMTTRVSIRVSADMINTIEGNQSEQEQGLAAFADAVSNVIQGLWESNKMDSMCRDVLLDAALSGDGCVYVSFDDQIEVGNPVDSIFDKQVGDITCQRVDGVNVFFGNPHDPRINHNGRPVQPYILIASRELVKDLVEEAKAYGGEVNKIFPDSDYEEQIGQYGKIDLLDVEEAGMATVLRYFYPQNGTIHVIKACKLGIIRPDWDTKLSIYPVAWFNWDMRKNSYHGQAVCTGLIPNQIFINKAFAMLMLWLKGMAIPKIFYDASRINDWSNQIAQAIPIEGDVTGAAMNMSPSQLSNQVFTLIDKIFQYTKETIGATETGLGQIKNPDNMSAIVSVKEQSEMPLENQRMRYHQFIEDLGYIVKDYMSAYYGNRYVSTSSQDGKTVGLLNFDSLKQHKYSLAIDVGETGYWSEIAVMRTLDNLLQMDRLTFIQYLERYPKGQIPKQQELIDELKKQAQSLGDAQSMDAFIQSLPEEEQQRLASLPTDQFEQEVRQMMSRGQMPQGQTGF